MPLHYGDELSSHQKARERRRKQKRRKKTQKRDFSQDERKQLASEGKAQTSGSFPIRNRGDLRNAIMAFGRSKTPQETKAHIIRRARSLGLAGMLPSSWVLKSEGWSITADGGQEFNDITIRGEVVKHSPATHEQKTHGNWARPGTRQTTRSPEGRETGSAPDPNTKVGHFNSAKLAWRRTHQLKGTEFKGPKGTEAEVRAVFKKPRDKMIAAAKVAGKWSESWEKRVTDQDNGIANRIGTDSRPAKSGTKTAVPAAELRARLRADPKLRHLSPRARARRSGMSAQQVAALGLQKNVGHDQSVHGNWARGRRRANRIEAGAMFTGFIDPETGEVFGMDEARERRRSLMRKHKADHDEKSHGNWARGGGGAKGVRRVEAPVAFGTQSPEPGATTQAETDAIRATRRAGLKRIKNMTDKQIDARMKAIRRKTRSVEPKGNIEFIELRNERGRRIIDRPKSGPPTRITQSD